MKEQVIAKAYAKAIVQIGKSKKIAISKELDSFFKIIKKSDNFRHVLFSGMFSIEEKENVCKALVKKMKLSTVFRDFVSFLLWEKRISLYSLIVKEALRLDDEAKGVIHGSVEGVESTISNDVNKKLVNYLEKSLKKKIFLNYVTKDNITSGYRVCVEDLQLDASVDKQLEIFEESLLEERT